MTMAFALFDTKKTKAMRAAIAHLERAVEGQRPEVENAEGRLRDALKDVAKELARMPIAGSLVWKGRRDG